MLTNAHEGIGPPLPREELAASLLASMVTGIWNATPANPMFEHHMKKLPGTALWLADALNACIEQNPVSQVGVANGEEDEPQIIEG